MAAAIAASLGETNEAAESQVNPPRAQTNNTNPEQLAAFEAETEELLLLIAQRESEQFE